jgi:hypothetical protein
MFNCFTYGSLMYEPIMSAVCALKCAGVPATLADYRRHPIRNEEYPAIVPAPAGSVSGILYRDLPASALARLDAFEGEQYVRTPVMVRTADGHIAAESYIFRPEYANLLAAGDWDYAYFLATGRQRFEQQYGGFSRV